MSAGLNSIEREAVYRIREMFAENKTCSAAVKNEEEEAFLKELSRKALYPEKPLISCEKRETGELFFHYAEYFQGKEEVRKFVTCGGVDDGKSTLIGRILYDTGSEEEREVLRNTPEYLRTDGSVDYAMLAGASEEEAKQGITVQVSYSVFDRGNCSFLMADVPGHEEYTCNMAYAASNADAAVIMIAANKGIVPQTRRHTRICYFMGIRNMVFAVNKMDMVSYRQEVYRQIQQEVMQMMQEYPECACRIVPVAAKSGENIILSSEQMPWYQKETLLEAIGQKEETVQKEEGIFCMPVQRVCKSSQMKDAVVKKRVIQGEVLSGTLSFGDELMVHPTGKRARVTGIYCLDQKVSHAKCQDAIGIEMEQELDVARGYILTGEDMLTVGDRIEADILWVSDERLTQGKRYLVKIGTRTVPAAITKICYRIDVNTGEHRYAEHLVKNAMARCEFCFPEPIAMTCVKENRTLGTFLLLDREEKTIAGYGNIMQTISEDAWKEDGRAVTASEREAALGQKAGLILFPEGEKAGEWMNYVERYLLRMGFHTIQAAFAEDDGSKRNHVRQMLDAGLFVLVSVNEAKEEKMKDLLEEERIFDYGKESRRTEDIGIVLKKMKQWASRLI